MAGNDKAFIATLITEGTNTSFQMLFYAKDIDEARNKIAILGYDAVDVVEASDECK